MKDKRNALSKRSRVSKQKLKKKGTDSVSVFTYTHGEETISTTPAKQKSKRQE